MRKVRLCIVSIMVIGVAGYLSGCANLSSSISPNTDLKKYETYYVVRHARDKRHIDEIIRDEMQVLGLKAQSGVLESKPADVDVIVTYEDRWAWDITNYMISLTIYFKDAHSNVLLATGQSYRPSLVRRSPDVMARETLASIFKKK